MARALVLTVGTGTRPDVNIVNPLVKTVRDSAPEFTVLVASSVSRKYGEQVALQAGLAPGAHEVVTLVDAEDFQSVFREVVGILRGLRNRGTLPEDTELDFTSGTKAMSAGAVLAAVYCRCRRIKYITGDRLDGVVVDGTERFLSLEPAEVFASHDLQLGVHLMERLRFRAALDVLPRAARKVETEPGVNDLWEVRCAAEGYRLWDLFDHEGARKAFDSNGWTGYHARGFRPTDGALTHLRTLAAKGDGFGTARLVDLYNNARRRAIEGKFDDAVARLYRATEMFAQWLLKERYGIDTSAVDIQKIPPSLRETCETHRNYVGKVQVGLQVAYRLLEALGEAAGAGYLAANQLQSYIGERNTSILAHGVRPMNEKMARNLQTALAGMFELEIVDFRNRAAAVQFPWLLKK